MKKLIVLAVLLPLGLFAQLDLEWSDQLEVNSNMAYGYARPKIALTSNGTPIVMWSRRSNREVYISKLNNGVFNAATKITPSGVNVFAQDWAGPDMVAQENIVLVTFEAEPHGEGLVYLAISKDWGNTFADTVRVSENALTRFPTVAIAPDGTIYVAFMVFELGDIDPHYAVTVSKDGGKTFSNEINATVMAQGETCDCCPAYLVASNIGATLFFRNNNSDLRDIWASISKDTGKTFGVTKKVDNTAWIINACPSSGPSSVANGDSFATVWMSGSTGSSRVHISNTAQTNLEVGWDAVLAPNALTNVNQNYPIIAGRFGTYGVVWEEISNGKWFIKFVANNKSPNSLLNQNIYTVNLDSAGVSKNPHLVYANGVFHITWQDNSSRKVYYRSATLKNFTSISNAEKSSANIYPNPSKSGLFYLDDVELNSTIMVTDISGKIVMTQNSTLVKNVDLSPLGKGMYFISIEKEGKVDLHKLIYQ